MFIGKIRANRSLKYLLISFHFAGLARIVNFGDCTRQLLTISVKEWLLKAASGIVIAGDEIRLRGRSGWAPHSRIA